MVSEDFAKDKADLIKRTEDEAKKLLFTDSLSWGDFYISELIIGRNGSLLKSLWWVS